MDTSLTTAKNALPSTMWLGGSIHSGTGDEP